jgi:hypoxanthine phosphoribosyltransferase
MTVKTLYYDDLDIKEMVSNILMHMHRDNWKPDYIVGITRGGLIPAVYMSHYLDVRMETLKVALHENQECETNCWMAEDAFGYTTRKYQTETVYYGDPDSRKNILIVDDINNSGDTLNWIVNNWQSSCMPFAQEIWDDIWGNSVRFAVLHDTWSSQFKHKINYAAKEITNIDGNVCIKYPWERNK